MRYLGGETRPVVRIARLTCDSLKSCVLRVDELELRYGLDIKLILGRELECTRC